MNAANKYPVTHFEIGCRDLKAMTQFYNETFGWNTTNIGVASLVDTNSNIGIPGQITALGHEPGNYVTIYIRVSNIADTLFEIERAGGEKIVGPVRLPDNRQFAWFKDPEGNMLGVITEN